MIDEKLDGLSMDIEGAELEKLKALFPQCFVEGKLDINKLLSLCGEYIEDDANNFEKYEFRWKGKQACLQLAGKRSCGTLLPCPQESVNFNTSKNIYIEGDNLEVLKLLQASYFRKVKMIYIDPPYNTGNDFVYADDFSDPLARYKEITQQTTKSNPETMGRFHTNWLNMMYPRLRLAANLLRDDGVIFISIDDNEVHNLRKLCDEVFGEENFVAELVWERAYSPKNDAKYISNSHDYVLMYAKSLENFVVGRLPRTEEANARYSNPDNDERGVWKSTDMSAKTYNIIYDYEITLPSGRIVKPPHGSCWRLSKDSFTEKVKDNRISFGANGDGVPRIKTFLSELKNEGMAPQSLLFYKEVGHSQEGRQELKKIFDDRGYFDGPKPIRLLNRLLTLANTTNNDIILDFFSGSATTAHAVMQLNAEDGGNRRFVCVQLPELCDEKSEAFKAGYKNICEIGKERIRRAGEKIKSFLEEAGHSYRKVIKDGTPYKYIDADEKEVSGIRTALYDTPKNLEVINKTMSSVLDIGFRVFKLDSSNLKIWDDSPVTGENAVNIVTQRLFDHLDLLVCGRSDIDVTFEVMLKLGQDLCLPVVQIDLDDNRQVYGVGDDVKIIVCLVPSITMEDTLTMAAYKPEKIVFAERCFDNSTDKSNVRLTLKDKGIAIKTL